jgi:chitinase
MMREVVLTKRVSLVPRIVLLASVALAGCGGGAKAIADGAAGAGAGAGGVGAAGAGAGAAGAGAGAAGAGAAGAGGAGSGGASAGKDGGALDTGAAGRDAATATGLWVLGYWAVWQAQQYPIEHVAWKDMTHVALSFVEPRAPMAATANSPYRTLDTSNAFANLGATGMKDFATAAHAGGTRPLISLGGGGAGAGFAAAAAAANRTQLVADILAACAAWGYDGVDLDWEDAIVYADFKAFVRALRQAAPSGFLITVPVGSVNNNAGLDADSRDLWSTEHADVDQLNVMTYSGSGNYPGWVVWYLSPLFGAGPDHPFDVASTLTAWSAAGVPKAKLGLGLGFYGRAIGPPVTAALQSYGTAQVYANDSVLSYGSITRYFENKGGAVYHWDKTAMAGWLGWSAPFQPDWSAQFPKEAPPTVQFLTYEDPAGVAAKGQWAKANGYGGAIIWTINEGVAFPDGSDGYANPLLDAAGQAFR